MENRYMVLVLVLIFSTVMLLSQEIILFPPKTKDDITLEEKNAIVFSIKEKVSKLKIGMTAEEVETIMGSRSFDDPRLNSSNPQYYFDGKIRLSLGYDMSNNELFRISNNDGFNLLSTQYTARTADFPVSIDGAKLLTSNPIIVINKKTYVPLEDLAEQLGVKIDLDKELFQKETLAAHSTIKFYNEVRKLKKGMTGTEVQEILRDYKPEISPSNFYTYIYGENQKLTLYLSDDSILFRATDYCDIDLLSESYLLAIVTKVPIYINSKELILLNPIVSIDNVVYVPVDDCAEQFSIKINFNKEKQCLEIINK